MKKCPFCAEEVQDEAVKCRHCGEFFDPKFRPSREAERPWYFRTGTVVAAILCLLAFALPLVWFNPYYSRKVKIVITLITVAVTVATWMAMAQAMKSLGEYYRMLM